MEGFFETPHILNKNISSRVEEEVHKTDSLYKLSFFHYRCIAHSFVYTISKQTARDSQSKSISDRFPTDWAFNDLVSTELTCPMRGRTDMSHERKTQFFFLSIHT